MPKAVLSASSLVSLQYIRENSQYTHVKTTKSIGKFSQLPRRVSIRPEAISISSEAVWSNKQRGKEAGI